MGWITKEELQSFVSEYGNHAFDNIVYQEIDDSGEVLYTDITHETEYILGRWDGIGLVYIIQDPVTD